MGTLTRPTVAILFMGGATIDERHRLGDTVTKPAHVQPWLRAMSEMDIIAETRGFFISDSAHGIGVAQWQAVGQKIEELYDQVDGFVVIHQVGMLPAAATALSLMLSGIGKPVVLCGSPLDTPYTRIPTRPSSKGGDLGAKAGFINAVQVAASDASGIIVVHGSHMFLGSTVQASERSLTGDILGKIDFGIRFFGQHPHRSPRAWKLLSKFDTRVAVVEYLPGVDITHLTQLPRGTRAILLSSPEGVTALRSAVKKLRTVLPSSFVIAMYGSAKTADIVGVISVTGSTRSSAVLKLMWALGQTTDAKKLKKLLS